MACSYRDFSFPCIFFVSSQQKTELHFPLPFHHNLRNMCSHIIFTSINFVEQKSKFKDLKIGGWTTHFFHVLRQKKVKTMRQTLKVNVSSIRFCAETWKNSTWLISFEAFHLYNNTNSIDSICRIALIQTQKFQLLFHHQRSLNCIYKSSTLYSSRAMTLTRSYI